MASYLIYMHEYVLIKIQRACPIRRREGNLIGQVCGRHCLLATRQMRSEFMAAVIVVRTKLPDKNCYNTDFPPSLLVFSFASLSFSLSFSFSPSPNAPGGNRASTDRIRARTASTRDTVVKFFATRERITTSFPAEKSDRAIYIYLLCRTFEDVQLFCKMPKHHSHTLCFL